MQPASAPLGLNGNLRIGSVQLADPDVAVTDRIAVVLEEQRSCGSRPGQLRRNRGVTLDRNVVLNQYSIVQHRERTGLNLALGSRLGRMEHNVVGLVISRQLRKVSGWMTST